MTFGLSRDDYVRSLIAEARSLTDKAHPTFAELQRAKDICKQLDSYAKTRRENDAFRRAVSFADAVTDVKDNHLTNDSEFYDAQAEKQKLSAVLTNDPGFKAWYSGVAPSGVISDSTKGISSPPVTHKASIKALLTGASGTSAGAMVFPETQGLLGPAGRRELTLRDLITVIPTQSDQVQFAKWNSETNAAATVAEATATSGASGTKPESAMDFSVVTVNVRTLAHWMPVTRRAMADAPQLRALIDESLRFGLLEELEDQMMSGGGTGEDFQGLSGASNVQTQSFTQDNLRTLLAARTKVRTVGRTRPTAYLLNPADIENLLAWRDANGLYMMLNPTGQFANPTVWGLPIVASEATPAGTGYCGNFRDLYLFDREAITLHVTDAHSDWFVRNILAVLAELRAGFCVARPASFVKCVLSLGGS
jgi:HK97 family phage major capsid protein